MRFSIHTLLAAVAVVGIGTALWVAEPSWQLGLIEALFLIWVPASAVILSINSCGKARAWWIGFAAGCIFGVKLLLLSDSGVANLFNLQIPAIRGPLGRLQASATALSSGFRILLLLWLLAPIVGLLCVFTQWLLVRPPQGPQD